MEAALSFPIAGFILTNNNIERPEHLLSRHKHETGGLSGAPLSLIQSKFYPGQPHLKQQPRVILI